MRRVALVGVAMLGLPSLVFLIIVVVPFLLGSQPRPSPPQPIAFDHQIHVEMVGIECAFCHRTASQAMTAGYPDVQQCMFCHQVVARSRLGAQGMTTTQAEAEMEKLRLHWLEQRPIDWVRVHRMPDHVQFVHEAHIQAGFPCATCHGEVAKMAQAVQVRNLGMGDCITCHRQAGAPTECAVCHK